MEQEFEGVSIGTSFPDTAGKKPGLLVAEMASQLRVLMLIKRTKSRSSKCFRQLFPLGEKKPVRDWVGFLY